MRATLHVRFHLLLFVLLSVLAVPICALEWDRKPASPPAVAHASAIVVRLDADTFFASAAQQMTPLPPATPQSDAWNSKCAAWPPFDPDSLTAADPLQIILLLGGVDASGVRSSSLRMLPWAPYFTGTRFGQPAWVTAPVVSALPKPRDSAGFVAPNDTPRWKHTALLLGGATDAHFLASLWVLDLTTGEWAPLGPRLDFGSGPNGTGVHSEYDCAGLRNYRNDNTPRMEPSAQDASVDACLLSRRGMRQVDAFGCPWPAPRQGHTVSIVQAPTADGGGQAQLFSIGGMLHDGTSTMEVWRLNLTAQVAEAIRFQAAQSTEGVYADNPEQIAYLAAVAAGQTPPSVDRSRLCPLQWELLTEATTHSGVLVGNEGAPSPQARLRHSAAVSGTSIFVTGGIQQFGASAAAADIWALETRPAMHWISISALDALRPPPIREPRYNPLDSQSVVSFAVTFRSLAYAFVHRAEEMPSELVACADEPRTGLVVFSAPVAMGSARSAFLLLSGCGPGIDGAGLCDTGASTRPDILPSRHSGWTWYPIPFAADAGVPAGGLGAAAWVQLESQALLQFGGIDSFNVVRDTALWFDAGNQRRLLELPPPYTSVDLPSWSQRPAVMQKSLSVAVDRLLFMFGTSSSTSSTLDEFWMWDGATTYWFDMGPLPEDMQPTDATTVIADATRVYLYGGSVAGGGCHGRIFVFDTTMYAWSEVDAADISSITPWTNTTTAAATGGYVVSGHLFPQARCSARAAVLGRSMLLFGGFWQMTLTNQPDNALWSLDLDRFEWRLLQPTDCAVLLDSGARPGCRAGHSFVSVGSSRVISVFGSDYSSASIDSFSAAAWIYDLPSNQWSLLHPGATQEGFASEVSMVPRVGAAATVHNGRFLLVHGGQPSSGAALNTLHVLDFAGDAAASTGWRLLEPYGASIALEQHYMTDLPAEKQVAMFDAGIGRIHILDLDEYGVGPTPAVNVTIGSGAEEKQIMLCSDLIAAMGFRVAPVLGLPDTLELPDPFATERGMGYVRFATLAGALSHAQREAKTSESTLTLSAGAHSVRFLHTAAIESNLTLCGEEPLTGASDDGMAVFDCADRTDCSLVVRSPSTSASRGAMIRVRISDVDFRQGRARADGEYRGGALRLLRANVTLSNVRLSSSRAVHGGAISLESSVLRMEQVDIHNCRARASGGAILVANSVLHVSESHIHDNRAGLFPEENAKSERAFAAAAAASTGDGSEGGEGGGMAAISSAVSLERSSLVNNYASGFGGGLAASAITSWFNQRADTLLGLVVSQLQLKHVELRGNSAGGLGGGGAFLYQLSPASATASINSSIVNNVRSGLYDVSADAATASAAANGVLPLFVNVTFQANRARDGSGGAAYLFGTRVVIANCSFTANEAAVAGGALFWRPSLLLDGTLSASVTAWSMPVLHLDTEQSSLAACQEDKCGNTALYGPLIASPAVSLRLDANSQAGVNASQQESGGLVSPPIVLELIDFFGQPVRSDNDTFVSVGPSSAFGGVASVRAQKGVAVFDELALRIAPAASARVQYSTSSQLPFLPSDQATAAALRLTVSTRPFVRSGLRLSDEDSPTPGFNKTFSHLATCASGCALSLPNAPGVHTTRLSLAINVALFAQSYDELTVSMNRYANAPSESVAVFNGADLAHKLGLASMSSEAPTIPRLGRRLAAIPSSIYRVDLVIPSPRVVLSLRTGDDRVGTASGSWEFFEECPDGTRLHSESNECLPVEHVSDAMRIALLCAAAVVLLLVFCSAAGVVYFRRDPHFQASGLGFTLVLLFCVLAVCVGSILFLVTPSGESSGAADALCIARVWLPGCAISVVVSLLLSKAFRVVQIATSRSLKPRVLSEAAMWRNAGIALGAQVLLCAFFTDYHMTSSAFVAHDLEQASSPYLMAECHMASSFEPWLIAEIVLLGSLTLLAAYLSSQARGVVMMLEEIHHNSAIFTLLLLAAIVLPTCILVDSSAQNGGGTEAATLLTLLQAGSCIVLAIAWWAMLILIKLRLSYKMLAERKRLQRERQKAELRAQQLIKELLLPSAADNRLHLANSDMLEQLDELQEQLHVIAQDMLPGAVASAVASNPGQSMLAIAKQADAEAEDAAVAEAIQAAVPHALDSVLATATTGGRTGGAAASAVEGLAPEARSFLLDALSARGKNAQRLKSRQATRQQPSAGAAVGDLSRVQVFSRPPADGQAASFAAAIMPPLSFGLSAEPGHCASSPSPPPPMASLSPAGSEGMSSPIRLHLTPGGGGGSGGGGSSDDTDNGSPSRRTDTAGSSGAGDTTAPALSSKPSDSWLPMHSPVEHSPPSYVITPRARQAFM